MSTCLETVDISKHFYKRSGFVRQRTNVVRAVDRVSLSVKRGETLGLVGETGSGKTTLARLVLRVVQPTSGKVFLNGRELTSATQKELLELRRDMQMVFQDPYSSLNPRMTNAEIVGEPLQIHQGMKGQRRRERVVELLSMVGLSEDHIDRYPHQFSGGQRQRITIAKAIATSPSLIVLDEPTSALDVSVQAQILNLLRDLQQRFRMTYLFISHNLSVVKYMSTDIAVMYSGRVVEKTNRDELFVKPLHPYTQALLAAIPDPGKAITDQATVALPVETTDVMQTASGCAYRLLCPYAMEICKQEEPQLLQSGDNHSVACHLYEKGAQD